MDHHAVRSLSSMQRPWSRGQQTLAWWLNLAYLLFCMVFGLKIAFEFFNGGGGSKEYFVIRIMHMKFKFQCHKVVLKHSHAHLFTSLSAAGFTLSWQSWTVVTDIIWLSKPKVFTLWTFRGKVCLLPSLKDERENQEVLRHWYKWVCTYAMHSDLQPEPTQVMPWGRDKSPNWALPTFLNYNIESKINGCFKALSFEWFVA